MKLYALILFIFPLIAAAEESPITLDSPRGGWHYFGFVNEDNAPETNYPNPPIYRGRQGGRTMIQGKITDKQPERTLIVNGNPMRLYTDKTGDFTRGYTLGSGSQNVEVRSGKNSKRVQYYEANPNRLSPQLRIICSWDAPDTEIDLHVITPDGQHVTWSNPILKGGGGLDVDSVDGPGPEMFTVYGTQHGAYHIYVNYWGNFSTSGYNFNEAERQQPIITAQVTLIFYENSPKEKRQNFVVPLRRIGDLNLVKSFMF